MYSLSARGEGVSPELFGEVDRRTNMPHNSCTFALLLCAVWFVYFIFAGGGFFPWEGMNEYGFDSSELPIITLYPLYVPILVVMMIKERDLHPFKRFVLPSLSLVGIGIIIAASIIKHKMDNVWYLIVFAMIMAVGALVLYLGNKRASKSENAPIKE